MKAFRSVRLNTAHPCARKGSVMKIDDRINGFIVKKVTKVSEIDAQAYEMEHEKSGARLLWLDRKDTNKTFAISFKTLPENDTGVFHILEHSVLNGSAKYPVKEPFVHLLRGSLNTFLNAFTFPDKTMYPVASRNDKDFMNLVDVYLDAVFNPAIYQKPDIFYQEGWHYELRSKDEQPLFKGVVFNEMKGSLASADSVLYTEMDRVLYRDTVYKYCSGGDPEHIPELTYEHFIEMHKKYYHPSNSYICLDGSIDIDAVLAKIDGFLSVYDRSSADFTIDAQPPRGYSESTVYYEINPGDEKDEKTELLFGYLCSDFNDKERITALKVISDVLTGSNFSPLTKRITESGLAKNINIYVSEGTYQPYVSVSVDDTDPEKIEDIKKAIRKELERAVENGLDREELTASINSMEYRALARDSSNSVGLNQILSVMDSWLYGGDPLLFLENMPTYRRLRELMATDYYENLIKETFLESKHSALVVALPSDTLGAERKKAEEDKLARYKASLTSEETDALIELNRKLSEWQEAPDLPENVAKLPSLRLSDVEKLPEDTATSVCQRSGAVILSHDIKTRGVVYTNLYFNVSEPDPEKLSLISFTAALLGELGTASHTGLELTKLVRTNLGYLNIYTSTSSRPGQSEKSSVYLTVNCGALEANSCHVAEIINEILHTTDFSDIATIRTILKQQKAGMERDIAGNGRDFGIKRVSAHNSSEGVSVEYLSGYEYYRWLKKYENAPDNSLAAIMEEAAAMLGKILAKSRLTMSITGNGNIISDAILEKLSDAEKTDNEIAYTLMTGSNEGIEVPVGVSFAEMGLDIKSAGSGLSDMWYVVSKLLSLTYLWDSIRVQGGAYGTGVSYRDNGEFVFSSYRDPNPARSLDIYKNSSAFLRDFCTGGEDLTPIIIGTISGLSPLYTPRSQARAADIRYLKGVSYEDRVKTRTTVLETTKEKLLELCGILDSVSQSHICVVANKNALSQCPDVKTVNGL